MLARKIELNISEDIFLALNEKPEQLVKEMRAFAAIKFFELGKLSLGKAAELADMNKFDFSQLLSNHKISIYNYQPGELEDDVINIKKARNLSI